jgi:hypothetical protein
MAEKKGTCPDCGAEEVEALEKAWDEGKHPRHPKGSAQGGEFARIFAEAEAAGVAAGKGVTPEPMIVGSPRNMMGSLRGGDGGGLDPTQPIYHVPEGPAGFASVVVTPGNSAFARWMRKAKGTKRHYYGGEEFWVSHGAGYDYNQSMTRKESHAHAMAAVLRKYGIKARTWSRMD